MGWLGRRGSRRADEQGPAGVEDHGGVNVAVTQQGLDGVQAGSGLDEMGGERMAQGVHRADGMERSDMDRSAATCPEGVRPEGSIKC